MATYTKTTVADRNNIVGPSTGTGSIYRATVDRMIQTYTRFDFGIHWSGTDGTVEFPVADLPQVGLVNDSIIEEGSPVWGGTQQRPHPNPVIRKVDRRNSYRNN